jgi:hypothetical protein
VNSVNGIPFGAMSSVALAEELLLLAYDNESGKAIGSRIGLDLGMAAAVLVDLALAGRIAYSDGTIIVINDKPTGEPIADDVLARIAADTPHTPASWVQRLRHGLRIRVLADLCARGVICDVDEVRERLTKALSGDGVPAERTAALATLVAAVRMEPTLGLSADETMEAHGQLEKIGGGAGFTGSISLEESTIRPSVALVIAALAKAIDQALGAPRRVV